MTNKSISILVIEDEPHIRNILEHNLKLDGFEVYVAEDGSSGLKLAREKHLDLILLDWMMPGMDGMEVLAELKRDEKTEHIPVFMLTAKGTTHDLGQALFMGADDYIAKPFDPVEMGTIIMDKLKKTSRKDANMKKIIN